MAAKRSTGRRPGSAGNSREAAISAAAITSGTRAETTSKERKSSAAVAWKQVAEHLLVQQLGRARWYDRYTVRVATVTRQYDGP